MVTPPFEPKSSDDWLDLDLPTADAGMPVLPKVTPAEVYALNAKLVEQMVFDEAYFAESLARKSPERFVM